MLVREPPPRPPKSEAEKLTMLPAMDPVTLPLPFLRDLALIRSKSAVDLSISDEKEEPPADLRVVDTSAEALPCPRGFFFASEVPVVFRRNGSMGCALIRLMRFKRLISFRARSSSEQTNAYSILILISMRRTVSGSWPGSVLNTDKSVMMTGSESND